MSRVNDIIILLRQGLERTRLSDFVPYSDIHILFRAIASVLSEREVSLTNLFNLFYIYTAKGSYLDRRAKDYGLTRLLGSKAQGWVLVNSPNQDTNIPKGLILIAPGGVLQYEVTYNVLSPKGIEVLTSIESLNQDPFANLPAGVQLYSNFYPQVNFVVGRYRNSNGPQQGLVGAGEVESDEAFRDRLLRWLVRGSPVSKESLTLMLESVPGLGKVFIQEHYPITGYMTVYLGTSDSVLLNKARALVNTNKAAGVSFNISSIQKAEVNISVALTTSTTLDAVQIRSAISSYIHRLQVGAPLLVSDLSSYISQQSPSIKSVEVLNPLTSIPARPGQALSPGDIEVTIKVRGVYA
jgi:uncharacterized phage protein gp47/JayE